jgi:ribose transport system ATP-binding protein
MMIDTVPRVRFEGVTKEFPGVRALSDVSFDVAPGEVHALLGENGAGKSTLLRILSGGFRPTSGKVFVDGVELILKKPIMARAAGIAMIHQELQQVQRLTVAQNMFLGHPITRLGGCIVDRHEQERRAASALARIDPKIDPSAPIRTLKIAQRQIVEIARALLEEARVIAMDEPTSSLTPSEFDRLAEIISDLAAGGVSIIYVSHKMDEAFRVCHRATILRDGSVVGVRDLAGADHNQIVSLMVGRELSQELHRSFATSTVKLEVDGLSSSVSKVRDVSFRLHKGEVLGIAGLVGSGRSELLRLIAGADRRSAGTIRIDGRKVSFKDPRIAIAAGVGLCPEERKREGIIPLRSVASNLCLPSLGRYTRAGILDKNRLNTLAATHLRGVNLRPFLPDRPIRLFSGGNQQKAIIARWLATNSQILLFDEPTRGIDVGAKQEIHALIERLASEGHSIIVVSSELPEVIRLSDRVLVMRDGELAAELPREGLTEQAIVAHAIPGYAGQVPTAY